MASPDLQYKFQKMMQEMYASFQMSSGASPFLLLLFFLLSFCLSLVLSCYIVLAALASFFLAVIMIILLYCHSILLALYFTLLFSCFKARLLMSPIQLHSLSLHSKQYRFFIKNLSVLLPCNPRKTLQGFSWVCL